MTPLTILLGICLLVYIFVYNIVLMSISNAISDHLRKRGVSLKAEANLAGMTNSDFWKEVQLLGQPDSDPVLAKLLRIKKVLIMVGVSFGVAFAIGLLVR